MAISGGPDSVALAHAAKALPYPVILGHVDHQLRKSSAVDARFVGRLALKWDLAFRIEKVNVPAQVRRENLGIEEAARNLRYKALVKMALRERCHAILTAHTADDQAETVLFNFFRGAGATGLAGIPPVRSAGDTRILRPLLQVTRREILQYLNGHRLSYREDPTNRLLRFSRNRIRHETLPYLSRIFPGLSGRLVQSAEILREEEGFWRQIVSEELSKTVRNNNKRITIDLGHLLGYHKALGRRILRHLLPGLSFQEIERVFSLAQSAQGIRRLQLSGGLLVARQADKLVISAP